MWVLGWPISRADGEVHSWSLHAHACTTSLCKRTLFCSHGGHIGNIREILQEPWVLITPPQHHSSALSCDTPTPSLVLPGVPSHRSYVYTSPCLPSTLGKPKGTSKRVSYRTGTQSLLENVPQFRTLAYQGHGEKRRGFSGALTQEQGQPLASHSIEIPGTVVRESPADRDKRSWNE